MLFRSGKFTQEEKHARHHERSALGKVASLLVSLGIGFALLSIFSSTTGYAISSEGSKTLNLLWAGLFILILLIIAFYLKRKHLHFKI